MVEENGVTGDIVICPTCQKIWPHDTKFCTQCGTWIQSGKVMDPTGGGPGPSKIGPSPPGIGPRPGKVGPSPPGIGPQQPPIGPAPPGIGRQQPPIGPAPSGIGPQPGMTPGQPTGAPGAAFEGAPEAEPAAKKYAFRVEPHREEHVPSGPVFIPKRETRRKSAFGARQVVIVIVCVLAIGYAVISMAFKPLHGFLLGKAFETIGKPEAAIKQYQKAAHTDTPWAAQAEKAMTKLSKKVFARHIELQYDSSWTAKSRIMIVVSNRPQPYTFESTIDYTAPGRVTEQITGSGVNTTRIIDGEKYVYSFGRARISMNHDQYAQVMNRLVGFGPDTLFEASGKQKVLDAFFDTLETKLESTAGSGDETYYQFAIPIDGDAERAQKVSMLAGPFFPLAAIVQGGVGKIVLRVRANDGFLEQIEYYDTAGGLPVTQSFESFEKRGE
jgi:hypothetical protein